MDTKESESIERRMANLTPAQRELLATKMTQKNQTKPHNVILLKEGDCNKRRPLFCLHPPLGVTGYYINIANLLPADQPVYGIQSPALTGPAAGHSDMTEMAKDYFAQIKLIQPEPPYQFIGHSSGSFIAYEMSKLIDNQEQNQPFLFCVDQYAPLGDQEALASAYCVDDLEDNAGTIFLTCWLVGMAHNCELTFSGEDLAGCASRDERYEMVSAFFKQAGFIPQSADLSMVSKVLRMVANHFSADAKYFQQNNQSFPDKKYEGTMVVFRSTEKTNWIGMGIETEADSSPSAGWDSFCSNPVDVIDIPESDHINIFMEPAVEKIANELTKYLYVSS